MAPDDFTAFVASHGDRIARACAEITGNDQVADALRDELLVAVAGRWRRWPVGSRSQRALVRIQQHLQREARAQHAVLHPAALDLRSALRLTAAPADAAPDDAHLATSAWQRAERTQRRWWTGLGVAAVAAVAVAVLMPSVPPPAPPLPTEIPENVTLVPGFDELMESLTGVWELPPYLLLAPSDVDALPALRDQPLARASLVVQANGARLVVVGDVSVEPRPEFVLGLPQPPQRRQLEHSALSGARLVATSLSPDGTMIALPRGPDLVLVDVRTGRVRTVEVGAIQPVVAPVLTWLNATRVLLPGADALVVDVATGDISSVDVDGYHLLSLRGHQPPRLAELLPVTGSPCLGAWVGPGFAAPQLVVRACDPTTVPLPSDVGPASAAVAALDANGTELGTLVAVGGTRLDALGMIAVETRQALVAVRTDGRSLLVAWDPHVGTVKAVTHLNADAQVSVADLLTLCASCTRVLVEMDQDTNAATPVSASPTTS